MTEIKEIELGFHTANIVTYIAQMYPPKKVIPEIIQNSLDAHAKKMVVKVDAKQRSIWAFDNGDGASPEEIERKFNVLGDSLKRDDEEAIGQKGIGNLAPIGIADKYELVTVNRKNPKDKRRNFILRRPKADCNKRQMKMEVEDYPAKRIPAPGVDFEATTMVRLSGVNERALCEIGSIESVERMLVDAYSAKLAGKEIKIIWINEHGQEAEKIVQNINFRGSRMAPDPIPTRLGKVVFTLYLSPKPLDDARILVALKKGNYSMPLKNLILRHKIDREVVEIFESGYFEGTISLQPNEGGEFCAINASRDGFEYTNDLIVFLNALKQKAEQLAKIIEQLEDIEKNTRYAQVSDQLLKKYTEFFKDHPNMVPRDFHLLEPKKAGNVGQHQGAQAPLPTPKKVTEEIIERQKKHQPPPEPPDEETKKKSSLKKKVYQPRPGIRLEYVSPSPEEPQNWRSRRQAGMIQVNVLHSDFMAADRHGIRRLTDFVALLCNKELTCALSSDAEARVFSERFEDKFMDLWQALA